MIIENIDLSSLNIFHNFNNSISSYVFPKPLKHAEVTPIFKEDEETFKRNYRRISIISVLSKVFERLMYNQLYPYFKKVFSKLHCSLTKKALREKCTYLELFWSTFSRIRTGYGEILRISPYSVRMRENTDQKNSEYGHFLRSDGLTHKIEM